MSKKMAFLNTDKLWYVAFYTDAGDFSKLSEKGYETVELANASAGIPEGTPAGELVSDETVLEPATPAPVTVAEAPVETTEPVATPEGTVVVPEAPVEANTEAGPVADVAPTTGEANTTEAQGLENVPQGTENGPVAPETVQGEQTAPATESLPTTEATQPAPESAPVDTVKTEETAPETNNAQA